jgi:hypothetical protein
MHRTIPDSPAHVSTLSLLTETTAASDRRSTHRHVILPGSVIRGKARRRHTHVVKMV